MQTGRDEEDEAQDDQCKEEDPQAVHGGGHQCHTATERGKNPIYILYTSSRQWGDAMHVPNIMCVGTAFTGLVVVYMLKDKSNIEVDGWVGWEHVHVTPIEAEPY